MWEGEKKRMKVGRRSHSKGREDQVSEIEQDGVSRFGECESG